ncbi:hypothetical protein SCHPADRAFT_890528 [Schizopora paradoxa]|uniref:Uncharacterized protein n=1 Tax=Schizopora paradoxa TaxID=27342 RepID=A0A0H2RMA7_9AGAM|nr:hypothetical protein SCHPADRAFT_890528 [Schizopora paradoxa]
MYDGYVHEFSNLPPSLKLTPATPKRHTKTTVQRNKYDNEAGGPIPGPSGTTQLPPRSKQEPYDDEPEWRGINDDKNNTRPNSPKKCQRGAPESGDDGFFEASPVKKARRLYKRADDDHHLEEFEEPRVRSPRTDDGDSEGSIYEEAPRPRSLLRSPGN